MKDRTHNLVINLTENIGFDELIKGIPKGTEVLDLSGCFYHEPDEAMVSKLFKFIPSSVNTLKFPRIIRHNIKWDDLPKNVNHIIFSFPDGNVSIAHSNFSSLPESVTSVDLGCHISWEAKPKKNQNMCSYLEQTIKPSQ